MKHILITGASGNLGKELLSYLNFDSYDKIYLTGNPEIINKIIVDDSKFKIFSNIDLSNEYEVSKLFSNISLQPEDELFVLHLVGGYIGGKYFWEFDKTSLQTMINKNLFTSFIVAKYTACKVKNAKGGSIIFISSKLSIDYESNRSVYAISKAALNFLIKIIQIEGKEINLTANALAPKVILTDENKKWLNEKDFDNFISPQQIANQVEFIFSNYQKLSGNVLVTND